MRPLLHPLAIFLTVAAALPAVHGDAAAAEPAAPAAVLSGCREHIAVGLGDTTAVRAAVPPTYELHTGPDGRPLLFLNALACRSVAMDGVRRPLTASLVAAVVRSPDGEGCTSRLPLLGSVAGDALPLCNLYVLREIFDDPRVLDPYRAGAPDYPVNHVPELRIENEVVLGPVHRFALRAPGLSWDGLAADTPTPPVPFHVPLWWEPDAATPHAVVAVDFERLGGWTGRIQASPGSEWWTWFGGATLTPLTGPVAAGPSGTWDGTLTMTRSG